MTTTDPVADDVDPVADDGPDPHTTAGKIADLERRRHEAVHAGSAAAIEKQHARGKLTARERIGLLLDAGSFTEFDELARHRAHGFGIENNRPYGDGVITGTGTVDGRPVAVYSEDFTVFGGSLGEVYGEKIVKVMDHATKSGVACYQAAGEQDAVEFAKLLLSYLPSNNLDEPPLLPVTPKKHGNIPL